MIKITELNKSKNYKWHIYDKKFQEAIKVDVCIVIDNLETYYSTHDEIIYIDDLQYKYYNKRIEDHTTLTKSMLHELIEYLGWEDWNIGIVYYGFEQSMMRIKHIKNKKSKFNKLTSSNITEEISNIMSNVINNPHESIITNQQR